MAPEGPRGGRHAGAVSVEEHRARVLGLVAASVGREVVGAADALGRVLAEPVVARVSVPPYDHAAMDGFAVRAEDVAAASVEASVTLPVAGAVAAGSPAPDLPSGAALRIMTGAPVPAGADLVVPFEWTDAADPVAIQRAAAPGANIRRAGEDVTSGDVALLPGTRVNPPRLGLLVSIGVPEVVVHRRPRLAVLSTGAELATGLTRPGPFVDANRPDSAVDWAERIPDSNSAVLLAAGRAAGCEVRAFGPAPDDVDAFRARLAAAAARADLVVTTGGISAGDHDVVKAALIDDERFWFGSVTMKPGRPQGCGTVRTDDGREVPVVTLPGTPIAAAASFALFVVPAIRTLVGLSWRPRTAALAIDVEGSGRTVVLPGVQVDGGRITPLKGHAGQSQALLAAADALIVVPPTGKVVPAGTSLEVLALHAEEI